VGRIHIERQHGDWSADDHGVPGAVCVAGWPGDSAAGAGEWRIRANDSGCAIERVGGNGDSDGIFAGGAAERIGERAVRGDYGHVRKSACSELQHQPGDFRRPGNSGGDQRRQFEWRGPGVLADRSRSGDIEHGRAVHEFGDGEDTNAVGREFGDGARVDHDYRLHRRMVARVHVGNGIWRGEHDIDGGDDDGQFDVVAELRLQRGYGRAGGVLHDGGGYGGRSARAHRWLQAGCTGELKMNWLREFFKSKYVGMLEEENARLRAENRALLNSLLGTAGFAPIETGEAVKPLAPTRVRKRSWGQIQAMREEEAMK